MNCIIVDPDQAACDLLSSYVASVSGLSLCGVFSDAATALRALKSRPAGLIFTETGLPDMRGIDFITALKGNPRVVITSVSKDYTLDAYELGVTDYLLKPFLYARFLKAIDKVQSSFPVAGPATLQKNSDGYFFVKADNKFEKINKSEILYIEGLQNYITIQTVTKKVITYSTLKSIENYLCEKEFLRIQRSFIVSISKIDSLNSEDVVIGQTTIPISRTIRENVLKTILDNRLYKYQC